MKQKEILFRNLLNDLSLNHNGINEEYKYLGTGNPLSDILIIGKEVAAEKETEQYRSETLENFKYWKNLTDYDFTKVAYRNIEKFEPIYPYKGQILKINNGSNWGTSKTWLTYQKVINFIFGTPYNTDINFHENVFLTEVNSTPSKKTVNADITSIAFRKNNILNSDFVKNFPVTIISGVGYFEISKNRNEIEEIFDVSFIRKEYANSNKQTQPYWVHFNKDKTRIVINTYQLSIGIADLLLQKVANEIRKLKLLK